MSISANPLDEAAGTESAAAQTRERKYLFRGDSNYCGGQVGRAVGTEADAADIQNFADHVLRKESTRTSRFTSFTEETRIARKFTSAADNRFVVKAEITRLLELESTGAMKIWRPDQVFEALRQGSKKLARQAADVRAAMRKNCELLIEGQVPEGVLEPAN